MLNCSHFVSLVRTHLAKGVFSLDRLQVCISSIISTYLETEYACVMGVRLTGAQKERKPGQGMAADVENPCHICLLFHPCKVLTTNLKVFMTAAQLCTSIEPAAQLRRTSLDNLPPSKYFESECVWMHQAGKMSKNGDKSQIEQKACWS